MIVDLRLVGECNQCGLCCGFTMPDGGRVYCEWLRVAADDSPANTSPHAMGKPKASYCSRFEARKLDTEPLPIRLLRPDGSFGAHAKCGLDQSDAETWAIIQEGMLRGCSLNWTLRKPPPHAQPAAS